jgi:hypothetical protein|tara:strand:+ start:153 stop:707 length:555 start_codon:yes stop_codon:yes gene_type:complete
MSKVAKDKWDKVIEYLTHTNRDPQKVLNLLKGSDQGKESNYDVNRVSYSLNIIAIITQKQLDSQNKGKTLTHIIRHWVKSKDFIQFYNLMRSEEKVTWNKSKIEDYTKQLQDLWYSKSQSRNKEYFKKIDGFYKVEVSFNKTTGVDILNKEKKLSEELRPKAKIIEKTFDKIKMNERRSRTHVS